jgi:predicted RNase H-like HicB family nuclease
VEEVPGVNTQGATLAETRANLKEALAMILETSRGVKAPRPAAPPNGIGGTLSWRAGHHS